MTRRQDTVIRACAAFATLLLLGAGCAPRPVPSPAPVPAQPSNPLPTGAPDGMALEPTSQFGEILQFKIGDTKWFADGLSVTLEKINDSRCPEGVQCIWAGELAPVLMLKKEAPEVWSKEVTLGTMTKPQVKEDPYVFNLKNATIADIVLTVEKP